MTLTNQPSTTPVRTDTGEQVIQTAHVFTRAHRAIRGTQGAERKKRRDARDAAENKLFSACDADNKGGRP